MKREYVSSSSLKLISCIVQRKEKAPRRKERESGSKKKEETEKRSESPGGRTTTKSKKEVTPKSSEEGNQFVSQSMKLISNHVILKRAPNERMDLGKSRKLKNQE